MHLDKKYWSERYRENNTPWDLGQISPPLQALIDSWTDKDKRILIPGAGRAYEAMYLHERGFRNVWVCDWAAEAFSALRTNVPDFPQAHCLIEDFFELDLEVEVILEQTFFCAIPPALRPQYAQKTAELLVPGGLLAGLLFASEFPFEGPPFGGTREEYRRIFEPFYKIEVLEIAENSVKPRLGNELFFKFIKP